MRVSVHRLAENELDESTEFYAVSEPGVEQDFVDSISSAIDNPRQFPLASPIKIGEIRSNVLKTFPFSIFYRVSHSTIRILAISHQSREPYYWIDRE